jgi:uncharacterized protein (DUF1501 family)
MNRRAFLGLPTARERDDRVLVCVFLRGGADGLSLVVPHGEDRYHALRPTLAIARPGGSGSDRAVDLDGFFGLHPRLAPLLPIWKDGALGIVHAVGSDDETRSHFEAQDRMEHAGASAGSAAGGWIARHLATRAGPMPSALTAVAMGPRLPESLRGAPAASAVGSIDAFRLGEGDTSATAGALAALYAGAGAGLEGRLRSAGRDTLATLARLDAVHRDRPRAAYPAHDFGRALADVAALVRARAGLEVACVDLGNWDSHFVQQQVVPDLAGVLARGLAAFREDLGADRSRVDVVVMTEFGRRVRENGSLGTDHGHGSVMFLMGEGLGGPVRGRWPGLEESDLVGPGDLAVTTDYREVLAEILTQRLGNPRVDAVFPGLP